MTSRWPNSSPFAAPITVVPYARPGSKLARFFYGLAWLVIGAAGIAGLGFSLYRNDVLLRMAQQSGLEGRYLAVESRLLGTPGWGTPRSLSAELAEATSALPTTAAALLMPRSENSRTEATAPTVSGSPEEPPESATPPPASPAAASPTVSPRGAPVAAAPAAAPHSPSSSARSTKEGLTIVTLDALPTEPSAPRVPGPRSPSAPVAPTPPRVAPVTAASPPARSVAAAAPAPRRASPPAAPKEADAPPKKVAAAPAPRAKAAAKPLPAPLPDSPLNAAIRSAILKDQ